MMAIYYLAEGLEKKSPLREISDEYKSIIKPFTTIQLNIVKSSFLYSAYGRGFGNARLPNKGSNQLSSAVVGGRNNILKSKIMYCHLVEPYILH